MNELIQIGPISPLRQRLTRTVAVHMAISRRLRCYVMRGDW